MGIPGGANLLLAAGGVSTYEIDQSLRFVASSSTRLTRTPSSSGNMKTWTLSMWIKKWDASHSDGRYLWAAGVWSSGNTNTGQYWTGGDKLSSTNGVNGVNNNGGTTNPPNKFRDPSAWFHLVVRMDTANATTSNRHRIYINGELIATASSVSQNFEGAWNRNVNHAIGGNNNHGTYSDVYIAEVHNVDGQSLDPTSFGEYDDNGVWRPIAYDGSYGTNGFYLKFDPSATNGIGHDHSGNGNNFTPSGFSTSGTGTDVMSDTPTNNFATINPLTNISGLSGTISNLSEGNLYHNGNGNTTLPTTIAIPAGTGKWYWEVTPSNQIASSDWNFGVQRADVNRANYTSWTDTRNNGVFVNTNNSNSTYIYGSSSTTTAWTVANGDVVGVAFDASTGNISYYKNGSLQVTLSAAVNTSYPHYPAGSGYFSAEYLTWNFGQRAFTYTPPTGFNALNTSNLPEPDIADGSDYFNTVLYTGTSTTQSITGVGFAQDFLWIKSRSGTNGHKLYDRVRGVDAQLASNSNGTEASPANQIDSFNSDGFTLDSSGSANLSSVPYVAWNWLAGGSGSSNTSGSITSTVSANPSAGFSIVTWTGTGNNDSYGHGLGVKPAMIIHKRRNSTSDWHVWHQGLPTASPTNDVIYLNLTNGQNSGNNNLFRQDPTSTLIYTGTAGSHNVSGGTYVDYVFAEVEGYSKFGSYTGNGSSDSPFVFCGFKPRWILTKSSTLSTVDSNWRITDTARSTYNVSDDLVWANLPDAELANANGFDICSNGFKIRTASNEVNSSGQTYIFAAFAENPFGGSGVSPVTAR